jgi:hypothetical protein
MLYSELSARMVDVLGISLVRLLAACSRSEFDEISDSINTVAKNTNNPTDRITKNAIRRMRESFQPTSFSRGIFENLVSRYQQLERGKEISCNHKCPTHNTFLQPQEGPLFECWYWQGCNYIKKEIGEK